MLAGSMTPVISHKLKSPTTVIFLPTHYRRLLRSWPCCSLLVAYCTCWI